MGLKDCKITLDNPWSSYFPGQTVNGTVEYTFDSPKKVRGIYIKFKGVAETSWRKRESQKRIGRKRTMVTVHYKGHEEYFSISYYLVGSKSGNEMELPPGKHTFPFTCTLPPSLPSSFEGEFGFVRYTIKATLDRPWKFDQDTKMAFTIVSHLDLNLNPEYMQPIQFHMKKNFCCCCCKSGPLLVEVNLPVKGYCCGQVIPLDISCENGSNVNVNHIKIQLRKIAKYHSQYPKRKTKEIKKVIAELMLDGVRAHTSKNWNEAIQIPPLPPSNLTNCGIIDLDYEIKVVCSPSGAHIEMKKTHPFILGTVPLVGFHSPAPEGGLQPQPGVESPLLPTGPDSYPSDPIPLVAPGGFITSGAPSAPSAPEDSGDLMLPNVDHNVPIPIQGAGALYPSLAQLTFQEGQFAAISIHDADDHQNMMISGRADFAPRYLTYGSQPYPTYGGYPYPQQ